MMLTRLMALLGIHMEDRSPRDNRTEAERRAAELQERLARLEREVDVIQRTQTPEEPWR